MKKYIFLLYIFVVFTSCISGKDVFISTSFREPAVDGLKYIYSYDGLIWDSVPGIWLKPEVGEQNVLRDPSMLRTPDGVFHLVWTSSWKGDKGFGYASSSDLIHWSKPRLINVMQHEPSTVNVWAPELFYDDVQKDIIIVWSSCIPGRYAQGVEDEDNNHRLFYTKTKDFNVFDDAKLLFDPGFSSIDATIVKKADKDYVLVFKDNTRPNRNLKVAFANSPTGPYREVSETFSENFVEGPTCTTIGNEYYIFFDEYKKFTFGAVKTTDFRTFETVSDQIVVPQGHKHGTIIKVPAAVLKKIHTSAASKTDAEKPKN